MKKVFKQFILLTQWKYNIIQVVQQEFNWRRYPDVYAKSKTRYDNQLPLRLMDSLRHNGIYKRVSFRLLFGFYFVIFLW